MYGPKYVENGGHCEIQGGRQKAATGYFSAYFAILNIINMGITTI